MKNKHFQDQDQFLHDFFSLSKLKKNLTLKDLKKIEDESYSDGNLWKNIKKKKLYSL